jgi:hypothetical protein
VFRRFRRIETSPVDGQIDAILDQMKKVKVTSEEYPSLITHLERLHKLKAKARRPRVSPDAWVYFGTGVIQVLIIVAYEQKHVMTSRGFTLIHPNRPR